MSVKWIVEELIDVQIVFKFQNTLRSFGKWSEYTPRTGVPVGKKRDT